MHHPARLRGLFNTNCCKWVINEGQMAGSINNEEKQLRRVQFWGGWGGGSEVGLLTKAPGAQGCTIALAMGRCTPKMHQGHPRSPKCLLMLFCSPP